MPEPSILNLASHLQPLADATGLEIGFVVETAWTAIGGTVLAASGAAVQYVRSRVRKRHAERTADEKKSAEETLIELADLRKEAGHLLKGMPGMRDGDGERKFKELKERTEKLNITLTARFGAPEVCFIPERVFMAGAAKRSANSLRWGSHSHETPHEERRRKKEISEADSAHQAMVKAVDGTFGSAESAVRAYIGAGR